MVMWWATTRPPEYDRCSTLDRVPMKVGKPLHNGWLHPGERGGSTRREPAVAGEDSLVWDRFSVDSRE
jgi:hypothetical protein